MKKDEYLNNKIQIENQFATLLILIDKIYPNKLHKRQYLCLHPHCQHKFNTKGALRYHLSKSHLIFHIKKPIIDTLFDSSASSISSALSSPDSVLSPSPPTSPFSLYNKKKLILSKKAQDYLNSIYPPLECPICKNHFNKKTNVIKHLTDLHPRQEPYRCIYKHCNHSKLYATREGLIYHIIRFHDK